MVDPAVITSVINASALNASALLSAEPEVTPLSFDDPRICEPGGKGLFLPLGGPAEIALDSRFRVMLYGVGLVYCFLGVSIVADMFMAAIEKITSKQKKVKVPGGSRHVTVQVWNETVANLTLMALGSSAPEILLALNEVFKNEFFEGKLGPSTIVGSAAFNLFVIISVCINSIPNGEIRMIKETKVFGVTAVFSVLAYVWLLYIVQFNTFDVIEVWEGGLTFMYFFLLVGVSYMTDAGYFEKEAFMTGIGWCMNPVKEQEEDQEWSPKLCLFGWCNLICAIFKKLCIAVLCYCRSRKKGEEDGEQEGEGGEGENALVEKGFDPDEAIMDQEGEPIDFEAGIMTFTDDVLDIEVCNEEQEYTVTVYRKNGTRGRVTVKYSMVGLTAVPGYDFEEDEGELLFRDGMTHVDITMNLLPKAQGEKNDAFQLIIEDESETLMFNPYRDGGEEKNILTVHLVNQNPEAKTWRTKIFAFFDRRLNMDEISLGNQMYKEQIKEAFWCNGSREAQDDAGISDWLTHFVWFFWKVSLSAMVPPPVYLGGWVCFGFSLFGIGLLTIIVGDLAELFGCALGIEDAITAITIVAMGTSVPDLFASRAAATQDEYADASIVNVTGSNSVNVFLGIGLPWMSASIYWKIAGANEKWNVLYLPEFDKDVSNGSAVFVVRSGQLFFSVMVFTVAACICLTVIEVRRYVFGGELGGPSDPKAYSSFLLITLWFFYIALSIWKLSSKTDDVQTQIIAIVAGLHIIVVLVILFAILLKALKVSKKYIGEEGFWGIFVAAFVIGGRILVFLSFQMSSSG